MRTTDGVARKDLRQKVAQNARNKGQSLQRMPGYACRVGVAVGPQGWAAGEGTC